MKAYVCSTDLIRVQQNIHQHIGVSISLFLLHIKNEVKQCKYNPNQHGKQ